MPVLLLHRSQIDSGQWDDFMAASPQRILYAYSWYLDVVVSDWSALVWQENNRWQAVMPLPIRQKWGWQVIQQPFYCQLLGVFTNASVDPSLAGSRLLKALAAAFRYISIYSGRFSKGVVFPETMKERVAVTHILSLHPPYRALWQQYSQDRKNNLQLGRNFGWQTRQSLDIEPIIGLFRENHAAQIQGGVSDNAYVLLRKVADVLHRQNALRVVYAFKDEKIEAGALFAVFDRRIIYLFNAASPTGRKGNARTLLIDKIIQEYAGTDFIFDFESPEKASIASFYRSFGATEEEYKLLTYNNLPFPLKQLQEWRVERAGK